MFFCCASGFPEDFRKYPATTPGGFPYITLPAADIGSK
jgi:hypothetical protein